MFIYESHEEKNSEVFSSKQQISKNRNSVSLDKLDREKINMVRCVSFKAGGTILCHAYSTPLMCLL